MKILAIETSCDDTGVAILQILPDGEQKMLADLVSSQVKIHAPWGGVVPTLAKREHQKNLVPLLIKALKKAKLLLPERSATGAKLKADPLTLRQPADRSGNILRKILVREEALAGQLIPFLQKYQKPEINYIAVTVGPGLEPALWVGVNFARTLAYIWNVPIIPINHIEGHIAASFFAASKKTGGIFNFQFSIFKKILPALALIVSGGHTQLILIKKFGRYRIVGETRDDAAGEAFDKVAKMLNLGYPGGPAIAAKAAKFKIENSRFANAGIKLKINGLPRPMINSDDFDFSFSGLKTAALYLIKKLTPAEVKKLTPAIAAEFQQAVIDVLIAKTLKAARHYNAKTILLGGGVAANDALRQALKSQTIKCKLQFMAPSKKMCADNAAMIALATARKLIADKKPQTAGWQKLRARANLRL